MIIQRKKTATTTDKSKITNKIEHEKNGKKVKENNKITNENNIKKTKISNEHSTPCFEEHSLRSYMTIMTAISLGIKVADSMRRVLLYTHSNQKHKMFFALARSFFPGTYVCTYVQPHMSLYVSSLDVIALNVTYITTVPLLFIAPLFFPYISPKVVSFLKFTLFYFTLPYFTLPYLTLLYFTSLFFSFLFNFSLALLLPFCHHCRHHDSFYCLIIIIIILIMPILSFSYSIT